MRAISRVYMENQAGCAATYSVTEEVFIVFVTLVESDISASIHESERPDFAALGDADVFVGSGFDVDRLRHYGPKLKLIQ